jgi:F-type H+-transporting ATPase subunit b
MIEIGLDFKALWQLINFLLIMFLLNIVIYRPVRAILKKRAQHNALLKANISENQESITAHQEILRLRQAETRLAGANMWEEYKNKARSEELIKLREANAANAAFLAQQRVDLNAQIELAGARLDHEVQHFASDIAVKLLQRSLR